MRPGSSAHAQACTPYRRHGTCARPALAGGAGAKARQSSPLRTGTGAWRTLPDRLTLGESGERAAAGDGIDCRAGYAAEGRSQLFPAAGSGAESAFDVGEVRRAGCSVDLRCARAVPQSCRRRPAQAAYAGGRPRPALARYQRHVSRSCSAISSRRALVIWP